MIQHFASQILSFRDSPFLCHSWAALLIAMKFAYPNLIPVGAIQAVQWHVALIHWDDLVMMLRPHGICISVLVCQMLANSVTLIHLPQSLLHSLHSELRLIQQEVRGPEGGY